MTPDPRIEELRAAAAYVADELRSLDETAGTDPLDEDAQSRFDEGVAYVESTRERITKLEAVRAAATAGDFDEPRFETPNVNTRTERDLFDLSTVRTGDAGASELRSRAIDAVERLEDFRLTDDNRERITRMVETSDGGELADDRQSLIAPAGAKARYLLEHGSPEYVEAFRQYMKSPHNLRDEHRAALSTTGANGGYLLPYLIDPTIIYTNAGYISPIRQLATVIPITTNIWHGVTSAGATAEWIGEATEVADGSPTFVQPTITTYKGDAYIQASLEVAADGGIGAQIAELLGEAKGRLEATAFAVGTGSGQPKGLITATSGTGPSVAGSSGAAGADDLVAADIFALDNALAQRWRANGASWIAHRATLNKIRQLNNGNTPYQSTFWVDFGGGLPSKLIGYPAYEASDMDSTIVSGSNDDVLVLGDVSQYYVIDRMGMEISYNPMVLGTNRRPTGEYGWVAFYRVGADVVTSNAFKTLRL